MRVFTVHADPRRRAPDNEAVLVKEGFCWPAALFTVLWALWHRLWLAAALMVAVGIGLGLGMDYAGLSPVAVGAVQAGYVLLIGFSANDWRRRKLARQGLTLVDVAAADGLLGAERRFFETRYKMADGGRT